ncbi:MAG: hypothetical protein ACK5GN_05840 [Pseudomonadota bacterium]|jgi:hypothetical protein
MDLKTPPAFAMTSILDRSGRRVGSYLLDRKKDTTEREKRRQPDREPDDHDEAAVYHSNNQENAPVSSARDSSQDGAGAVTLNMTA